MEKYTRYPWNKNGLFQLIRMAISFICCLWGYAGWVKDERINVSLISEPIVKILKYCPDKETNERQEIHTSIRIGIRKRSPTTNRSISSIPSCCCCRPRDNQSYRIVLYVQRSLVLGILHTVCIHNATVFRHVVAKDSFAVLMLKLKGVVKIRKNITITMWFYFTVMRSKYADAGLKKCFAILSSCIFK